MKTLASNLLNLKRDFRNYTTDMGKEYSQDNSSTSNNETKTTPESLKEDKLSEMINFKTKPKTKKSKSFRDKSKYDINNVPKKYIREKVKRGRGIKRNSFDRD